MEKNIMYLIIYIQQQDLFLALEQRMQLQKYKITELLYSEEQLIVD